MWMQLNKRTNRTQEKKEEQWKGEIKVTKCTKENKGDIFCWDGFSYFRLFKSCIHVKGSTGVHHMDKQGQDDKLEPTYSSSVPIRDVALKTYIKQCTIERAVRKIRGYPCWWCDMMMMMKIRSKSSNNNHFPEHGSNYQQSWAAR